MKLNYCIATQQSASTEIQIMHAMTFRRNATSRREIIMKLNEQTRWARNEM